MILLMSEDEASMISRVHVQNFFSFFFFYIIYSYVEEWKYCKMYILRIYIYIYFLLGKLMILGC